MATQTQRTLTEAPVPAERGRALCLVVHDELELRLRLAALVRRAIPKIDADTVTRAGFDAISIERLRAYIAVMFIVEFSPPEAAAAALASLELLHKRAPHLPIFVFARGGNERTAARAMKLGASDYWPIHSVMVGELCSALQPLLEPPTPPPPTAAAAPAAVVDKWRQPRHRRLCAAEEDRAVRRGQRLSGAQRRIRESGGAEDPGDQGRSRSSRWPIARDSPKSAKFCPSSITAPSRMCWTTASPMTTCISPWNISPAAACASGSKHPVSEADAVNYAHQIGEALQIVHAARIVHRDLKPSNLMLTNENRLVLIDFGSARTQFMANDLTRSEDCTGTPYYVCPEQIDDREPDARGDLYSLGVVLFEMLSGALPFIGNNAREIFWRRIARRRSRAYPNISKPTRPIIDRLLAKAPQDRYACAAEFLDALDGVRAAIGNQKSSNS